MTAEPGPVPLVLLMGPTAAGKTDLALELVERYPFEIVSVDSAMVYRGMDIGTAKPGAAELARAPHRLIDILDPEQAYSAARFRQDALAEIDAIARAGRIPLLVGGTMLYFRALTQGLSKLPPGDPAIRQRLAAQAAEHGWAALHERLREVDPQAAARIHPNDPQRIQRALEVYLASGRPMTELQREDPGRANLQALRLGLAPGRRDRLHDRIARRFEAMLERGLLDEVRRLRERPGLSIELPSMRAVGYRQVWQYLDGTLCYDDMLQRGIAATRQLAKRQLTWLRAEPDLHWIEPGGPGQRITSELSRLLKRITAPRSAGRPGISL